jgi:hypothetical protein
MRSGRHGFKPGFDRCEARLALSTVTTVPPPIVTTGPTTAPILSEFAKAYLSALGSPRYNPAVDANHNGIVAMGDALPLLRTLAPVTPKALLRLTLTLAPGDQVNTPHPANSGGVTRQTRQVTIIGHTVPNSLVFTDDKNNDFRFRGGSVIPVDSAGFFSLTVTFTSPYKISQHDFLVMDPFGMQLKRAFPIVQLPS